MPLSAGTKLGSYEIVAQIGAGGMGEVYKARDTKLKRDVALKVLPEAFAGDSDRMARFQREAEVLAALNHPNIATIYGLEHSNGTHALAMELVPGETLADGTKREGALPVEEALKIAVQIAEALEAAHEKGIIHRDLKPANVKVTPEGKVKVLDFGLAKAFTGDTSTEDMSNSPTLSMAATMAGTILGTAAYMSPEQAKGKPVDRRADIWAFGVVFVEMLTGKQLYTGETAQETLALVIMKEVPHDKLPSNTPAAIRILLRRCLEKDPRQRLRDIGEARIAIERVGEAPAETVAPAPTAQRRRPFGWIAAPVLLLALAGLSFVHFREVPPAPAGVMRFQIPIKAGLSFALSPDGRQLAFSAPGADGLPKLWVRALDSLTPRELPVSDLTNADTPFFWSPDSRYLTYDGGGKLRKIDISGGPPQTVCDIGGSAVGGSWNNDGVIIFGQSPGVIMRVSANGGPAIPLTVLDSSRSETQHVLPWFLPDGKHFLYHRTSSKPEDNGIYIGSLDAKPEKQNTKPLLTTDVGAIYAPSLTAETGDPGPGQLLFLRDGALMAQPFDARQLELSGEATAVAEQVGSFRDFGFFSAGNGKLIYKTGGGTAGGSNQITWFDRQGKVLGAAGEAGNYSDMALSPDGTRAVVNRFDSQNGKVALWLVDFSRGTTTRFNFDSFDAVDPIWSSDGSGIIFGSDRNGAFDIYEKSASGAGDEELLLKSSENKDVDGVTHDGRFLLYGSKGDLWALPLTGDREPFLFLHTEFKESEARFSPDDHWVAYVSDESGQAEIYVRKFSPDSETNGGGKWQVSYGGGRSPSWGAHGKELYYLTPDGKLMAIEVGTVGGFQARTPRLLFQVPPQPVSADPKSYSVDGKRFLFLAPVEQTTQAPFTLVMNWQAELKK